MVKSFTYKTKIYYEEYFSFLFIVILLFWSSSILRIRILFGFQKITEYEYEYYSVSQKLPNTNTNIIRLSKKDRIRIRIRILFGFPKMTQYEYYSDPQKYIAETSQTNANSVSMQSCMHSAYHSSEHLNTHRKEHFCP